MSVNKFHSLLAALCLACSLSASTAQAATVFSDDFTGGVDPAWVTDRYEPQGFASVPFLGDDRLQISISDAQGSANRPGGQSGAFYNTQGRKVAVGSVAEWSVSAEVYVSDDMLTGNNLRRTDLWARTGDIGTEVGAAYPIIGLRRFDPADAFNPNAANISTVWRVWDADVVDGWVDLAESVTAGWNTLQMVGNATSVEFFLNGSSVYVDSTVNGAAADLTDVMVQGYNFNADSSQNYVAYWDNVNVSAIPEPASLAMAGAAGLGLFVVRRRRK